jgi:Domain of unknown function (DUF4234)
MSDYYQGATGDVPAPPPPPPPYGYAPPVSAPGGYPAPGGYQPAPGGYQPAPYGSYPLAVGPAPIGGVRSTGLAMLLFVITFGIYGIYWFFVVHEEMKRHKGTGIGGGIALLIYVFAGFVSPFLVSSEVGELYERRGLPKPVSGLTGLWYLPGALILVGPIVWFVKTNGALNAYWTSLGAR